MPRYHVVLLDADNTLFDFDSAERKALRLTLERHGIPAGEKAVSTYVAVNKALWERFDRGEIAQKDLVVARFAQTLEKLGLTGDADELNRFYLAALGEQNDVLPGAVEFCEALIPHCTLALVTNGVASVQHGRLDRSPLGRFFPRPFISEEIGVQKPQIEFFEAVFGALGVTDRSGVVMVGDTLGSDILGGIRSGVDTIWFNPKGLPGRADIVPTHTVSDFKELEALIRVCAKKPGAF